VNALFASPEIRGSTLCQCIQGYGEDHDAEILSTCPGIWLLDLNPVLDSRNPYVQGCQAQDTSA